MDEIQRVTYWWNRAKRAEAEVERLQDLLDSYRRGQPRQP